MTRAGAAAAAAGLLVLLAGCGSGSVDPTAPAPTTTAAAQPRAAAAPPTTATPSPTPAPSQAATVVKVVDGDTLHVRVGGQDLDVRVVGENSPETKKPQTPVQCWGPQASAEAHRILDGQTVQVRPDPTQAQVDRYGRTLDYVTLPGGEDLSVHMVTGGWSRAYKVSGRAPQEWPQLLAAQAAAQAAHRGLWGPPCSGGV